MTHDPRFKNLIREFFADFLRLFFREFAERLDFLHTVWLDKEFSETGEDGSLHILDLVARVPLLSATGEPTEETQLVLIHIEIESPDRTTSIKPRMSYYYHELRKRYQLPVLPIVIFLNVALDGIGVTTHSEFYGTLEVNRFQFLYVGLPGLDAVQYSQGDNWFGVALSALMRIPPDRVVELGTEALRRLVEAPITDQQRLMLAECVQAYLPLNEEQRQEYERMIFSNAHQGVQAMNQTVYEKGVEKGIEKGIKKGQVEFVLKLLAKRLGAFSEAVREQLQKKSEAELQELAFNIPGATSFQELGLAEHASTPNTNE